MTQISGKFGLCLVLYDPRHLRPLVNRVLQLQASLGAVFDVLALVAASSSLTPAAVRALCESLGLRLDDCRKVDDTYFDFSCYREASLYFSERGYDGVLYINDTLIPKHDSPHLMAALCSRINMVKGVNFDFPLLIGPYSQSEFSFGDGSLDHFVPTFLFYLNSPGVRCFVRLLEEMPMIQQAIEQPNADFLEVDTPLLRFCQAHALQLRGRYLTNNLVDARLWRKLTTAYCERLLSGRVRSAGVVWYVAGGLVGRLLVPVQVGWSRVFSQLRARKVSK
ncbi:hypothetical protein RCH06_001361 [Polaromonas sp. CG_9.5]|uniref:hypothetical protein n=1 Tax=Polaromonas sp. CG_9.5 TaxID=3071705 RepID=UPI002E02A528|nr:hypothetical protein [Polaromonas sp. CG_9.5]